MKGFVKTNLVAGPMSVYLRKKKGYQRLLHQEQICISFLGLLKHPQECFETYSFRLSMQYLLICSIKKKKQQSKF